MILISPPLHADPVHLPPEGSDQDKLISLLRAEYDALLTAHKQAISASDTDTAATIQHQLLTAFSSRFCAALDVRKKTGSKKNYSIADCFNAALTLNLYVPINEPVSAFLAEEDGGAKHRIILDFGIRYRTAHRMVERVLEPYTKLRPFQFTNKGVPRAIKRVSSFASGPKTWVAVIDIKSFYSSFVHDLLKQELPLPHAVADFAVSSRHIETLWKGKAKSLSPSDIEDLTNQTRQALPTGASSSSLIAQIICSRLQLPSGLDKHLVNYGDDFCLVGETQSEVVEKTEALIGAIEKLPGGDFSVRSCVCRIFEGPKFLGYQLSWSNGALAISPSQKNWDRLFERLNALHDRSVAKAGGKWKPEKSFVVGLVAEQYACIKGFIDAFSASTHLDPVSFESVSAGLEMDLSKVGATWQDVKKVKLSSNYSKWENPSEFG